MAQSVADIKSELTKDNLREDVETLVAKASSSLDQARGVVKDTVDQTRGAVLDTVDQTRGVVKDTVDQTRGAVMDTVDEARAPGGVIDVATDTVDDVSHRVLAAAREHPVLVVTGVAAVAGGTAWLVAKSRRKRREQDAASQ